jgi:hypothetical protein
MSAMSTIIDIQVRANQVVTAVSNGTRAPVVFVMTLLEAMTATIPEMGVGVTVATAASCVLGGGYVRYQGKLGPPSFSFLRRRKLFLSCQSVVTICEVLVRSRRREQVLKEDRYEPCAVSLTPGNLCISYAHT